MRLFRNLLWITMLLAAKEAHGQSMLPLPDARYTGLAGAVIAGSETNGFCGNPARSDSGYFISTSTERPYGISGLSSSSIMVGGSLDHLNGGLCFYQWGDELYRISSWILAFGWHAGPLSMGGRIFYQSVSIEGNKELTLAQIDLGAQFVMTEAIRIAIYLNDVSRILVPSTTLNSPFLAVGLEWLPQKKVSLQTLCEKPLLYPLRFRLALEYQFFSWGILRWGVSTSPNHFSGGIGLKKNRLLLDYGMEYDPLLGIRHVFTLNLRWSG